MAEGGDDDTFLFICDGDELFNMGDKVLVHRLEERKCCFYDLVHGSFFCPELDLGSEAPEAVEQESGEGTGGLGRGDLSVLLSPADGPGEGVFSGLLVFADDVCDQVVVWDHFVNGIDHVAAAASFGGIICVPDVLKNLADGMRHVFCIVKVIDDCNRLAFPVAFQGLDEKGVFVTIRVVQA